MHDLGRSFQVQFILFHTNVNNIRYLTTRYYLRQIKVCEYLPINRLATIVFRECTVRFQKLKLYLPTVLINEMPF